MIVAMGAQSTLQEGMGLAPECSSSLDPRPGAEPIIMCTQAESGAQNSDGDMQHSRCLHHMSHVVAAHSAFACMHCLCAKPLAVNMVICVCNADSPRATLLTSLQQAELSDVMSTDVLPLLDLCDLGSLACTCSTFQKIVYEREDLWRSSAQVCT